MRPKIVLHFARHFFKTIWAKSGTKTIVLVLNLLALGALVVEHGKVSEQRSTIESYREDVRARWEANPDKHPHRMAHYGYVAFRKPEPLSFFDRGIDNYVGNAVFLEAHRQNTINYSEASLSTDLLRFGELSGAMILQILLPLLVLFWGYPAVAAERENGTLRLVFAQGARWTELIIGKALGLFGASLTVLLPSLVLTLILSSLNLDQESITPTLLRASLLSVVYSVYILLIALLTVWISAISPSAKSALLRLIGLWLMFVLVVPKVAQVVGELAYPTPSKLAFDRTVEAALREQGDSHDPDDPHFQHLKDSVLAVHNVATTAELPFNYSGFIMREGERLSTELFRKHQEDLIERFERQRDLVRYTALFNPYVGVRYASMALAGTDHYAYRAFAKQAEDYRYHLAQTMNELQMEFISNKVKTSADKKAVLSKQYWIDFQDFSQASSTLKSSISSEFFSLATLFGWLVLMLGLAGLSRKYAKVL